MIKEIDFDLITNDNGCENICGDFIPVLPTEYGESLTYYEALCKLSRKVDEFETGQVESVNGKTGVVVLTAEDVGALPVGTEVGAVDSVNGKTGVVVLTAEDVGALPVGTEVGAVDSVNGKTGVVVLTAEDVGAIPVGSEVGAVDSVNGQTGVVVLTAEDVGGIPISEKGANNGVATIDSDGYVVQPVRGGTGGAVDSVNGKTGVVVLTAEDIGALPVGTPVGDVDSVNGKTGVVVLTAEDVGALPVGTPVGDVDSVNGQTGDVVLSAEDVGAANNIHASTHAVGGSDPITPNSINALNKEGNNIEGNYMTGNLRILKASPLVALSNNAVDRCGVLLLSSGGHLQLFNEVGAVPAALAINTTSLRLRSGTELATNALQLLAYKNGIETVAIVFGSHNKPSGSYTGNGSATSRTIDTGGISDAIVLYGSGYMALVTSSGVIGKSPNSATPIIIDYAECKFDNGALILNTTNEVVNANNRTYYYQVL